MNKIISLLQVILILGCSLLYSSCSEDFLHKEPPGTLAGSALENPTGVEGLLTGAYAHLTKSSINAGTDIIFASIASDDLYKGSTNSDASAINPIERYEVLTDNSYVASHWQDCYNGVSRCNSTLLFLKNAQAGSNPLTDRRAVQVEAEAKYLRAWFHFELNKVFKNISYIKTPDEQDGKLADGIPNSSPGWADIEADLDFAIANLPEEFPGFPGRATKYAAITLKAQSKLYQGDYPAAASLLDQVINSGRYKLVDNFWDNYNEGAENNDESILELQCTTAAAGNSSMTLVRYAQFMTGHSAQGGYGFFQPSQALVDAYQTGNDGLPYLDAATRPHFPHDYLILSEGTYPRVGDPNPWDVPVDLRLDWTVSRRGVDFLGWGIMGGRAFIREQVNGGPWMTTKYTQMKQFNDRINGGKTSNDRNFRYHRYAHVLLWRAECHVEAGELNRARLLVNQIRERAKNSNPVMGLCTVTNFLASGYLPEGAIVDYTKPAGNYKVEPYPDGHVAFSDQANAREAVRMEIRLEFATEGQRFFDLRRWGQNCPQVNGKPYDIAVLNDYIASDSQFKTFMVGTVYSEKNRYWPVPQSQIDLQGGVLQQDPAWN